MVRRVLAALVAVALAGVGIWLVLTYANSADQRAMEGLATRPVLVATEDIPRGAEPDVVAERVEVQQVPKRFVMATAITDLDALEGRLASRDVAAGEQIQSGVFVTPDQLRAGRSFSLPEEAGDLHQLTIPLQNPRALGGSIAAGDLVGVFATFDVTGVEGYVLQDGRLVRNPDAPSADGTGEGEEESAEESGDLSVQFTDLLLNKVLVVRVEGGVVTGTGNESEEQESAADTINVTLALEAQDAARVIYAIEQGRVWLTLEPETASDDPIDVIVGTLPDEARSVLE